MEFENLNDPELQKRGANFIMSMKYNYDLGHVSSNLKFDFFQFNSNEAHTATTTHIVNFDIVEYESIQGKKFAETLKENVKEKDKLTF